ncbi:hypothetical protein EW146_g1425 [Bondarzewia mesenterica]|uniref:Uncharacterized protein n=1 Tax=Bondarzewia mesenterica TaxID=1095465 RepID=A0A4S4MA35_9AGAM|nr:hypothetical protein EW146_g1425 [Bondarzewia mesenterica]
MAFFGAASTSSNVANVAATADKDVEVIDPPPDSISSLSFSPLADYLAVGSWDNNVRARLPISFTVNAHLDFIGPVLSVCWNKEGNKLISGGCDNAARLFDIQTGQSQQVAQHIAPVKVVKWIDTPQGGILATGSWDKTLKYWDLRTANPITTVQLPERCYTFDVVYPLLVVGTAEKHIQIFNLSSSPTTPFKTVISPLKWQTRVVSCFPTSNGFTIGRVEGRVAIQYVDDKDAGNNYSFRCHRREQGPTAKDQSLVYAVNDITFHPVHGTFSTCGSDGIMNFWDKDARSRLKTFDPCPAPISATAFNRNGTICAYAVSYDWSKGHSRATPGTPNKVMLHATKDDESQASRQLLEKLSSKLDGEFRDAKPINENERQAAYDDYFEQLEGIDASRRVVGVEPRRPAADDSGKGTGGRGDQAMRGTSDPLGEAQPRSPSLKQRRTEDEESRERTESPKHPINPSLFPFGQDVNFAPLDEELRLTLELKANYVRDVKFVKSEIASQPDLPDIPPAVWDDLIRSGYVDFDKIATSHYMLEGDPREAR